MELYSTYIETDKFDEVVNFYEKVFEKKGSIYTKNRWIEFDFGNKLSIYNKLYDEEKIKNGNLQDNFNSEYIKNFNIDRGEKKNNIITLNFYTDNLNKEYSRIKEEGARMYPWDIDKYIEHKTPFIEMIYKRIGLETNKY